MRRKSFGMACFGCLFQKKPSRSRKGKSTVGSSKSIQGRESLLGNSKRSQSSQKAREPEHVVVQKSHRVDNSDRMIDLRKKIMSFRELVDLPPCIGSSTVIELVKHTVKELHKLHPDIVHSISVSDSGALDKAINDLCASIESLGKHWMHNDEWMVKSKTDDEANSDLETHVLALLDDIINVAKERRFNKLDMNNGKETKDNVDSPASSNGKFSSTCSPGKAPSPTSVLRVNGKSSSTSSPGKAPSPTSVLRVISTNNSAKIDPLVAEGDEGGPNGNVTVQMEISLPSSSLQSIVDSDNVQFIPSLSSARPSISATIVSSPSQILGSDASLSLSSGKLEISSPNIASPNMATNHTAESLPTTLGILPPPPPPPPPPPRHSVGERVTRTPPVTPPPSPSNEISNATSSSPPSPPSSTVTSNTISPSAAASAPPDDNGMPVSIGVPPPPPPPPAPTTQGSIPPPPAPAPTGQGNGSIPPPPPPAPTGHGNGSIPPPPSTTSSVPAPPGQEVKGGAPPPPPGSGGRLLRKSVSKLKRSSQMGCLYRQLKAKVEGSGTKNKTLQKKNSRVGAGSGGTEPKGMADALAEMTKRSSYFQQIEEDVKNYSDSIKEVKVALASFQTTDMDELIDFHKYVESHLEKLTDETQVLARFEDFPSKKLEGLRMAAALYSKLDAIATTLQTWDIEPPANQLLDRIENYFNKIKGELDTLERTKDDEIKKFKSQKIHFDFAILTRIKELMVDVSSSCMELVLKEKKLASASKRNGRKASTGKVLWKAFQFAFRVYSFAGGHDDRAENLTRELAQQIQADNVQ